MHHLSELSFAYKRLSVVDKRGESSSRAPHRARVAQEAHANEREIHASVCWRLLTIYLGMIIGLVVLQKELVANRRRAG